MRRSVAAFHMGRQIIATEPYRSLIFSEVRPGAHVIADDDIRAFIRQVAGTVYHPCGTCRMGQDDTRWSIPSSACAASKACAWSMPR